MIKSANTLPISTIFNIASDDVYNIPRYQRKYTWEKKNWEYLFDDLADNGPGYFLGSIICINRAEAALDTEIEVVDGQQRLVTLSLLFAAIYRVLKNHEGDLDANQHANMINLKHTLVLNNSERLRLNPQKRNKDAYRAVLSGRGIGIISDFKAPPFVGNRRIFKAYNYFVGRVDQIIGDNNNKIEIVMKFLDKVIKANLIMISVANYANAHLLFASLNNRGKPLSAIDLIKNHLLAALEKSEPKKIDAYFDQWNDFLKDLADEDDYATQERFFRHYYNAFRNELGVGVPIAMRSNLIHIYERLIDDDAKKLLDDLIVTGSTYSQLLVRDQDKPDDALKKQLQDLLRIQGAPAYLLLLYLFSRKKELQLESNDLVSVIKLLVCFFVRRNLTDIPPTRDLSRLFMYTINDINALREDKLKNKDKLHAQEVRQLISQRLVEASNVSVQDGLFKESLRGPIYKENIGATRFILYRLTAKGIASAVGVEVNLWDSKEWTIEHVFPQGKNIPKCWVDMIANGSKDRAQGFRRSHAHKLGNLTIATYADNSRLGNKCFEEKRDATKENEEGEVIPCGYKNGLPLNEDLANETTWTTEKIDKRTEKLADMAFEMFQLPSSPAGASETISAPRNSRSNATVASSKPKSPSSSSERNRAYWAALFKKMAEVGGPLGQRSKNRKPSERSFMHFSFRNKPGALYVATNSVKKNVYIYIYCKDRTGCFQHLLEKKDIVEKELGYKLVWKDNTEQVRLLLNDADPKNEQDWERQHTWLAEKLGEIHRVFDPHI